MDRPGVGVNGSVVERQPRKLKLALLLLLLDQQAAAGDCISCCHGAAVDMVQDCCFAKQVAPNSFLLNPDSDLRAPFVDDIGRWMGVLWGQAGSDEEQSQSSLLLLHTRMLAVHVRCCPATLS